MNDLQSKDNMVRMDMTVPTTSRSPGKERRSKKTRSKSIGPGGMDALKDDTDAINRRKSAFVPQSILPSKEDEQKRREARRKSLANRRVSFAPEATLHTWDVIEYMRDATTSTASSEPTRRTSSGTRASTSGSPAKRSKPQDANADDSEPPSTPPEQTEETPAVATSPAHQRDLHQKKRRRRSSGISPVSITNPDELYSSSPIGGDSAVGSSPFDAGADEVGSDDDDDTTAMSLVTDGGEPTVTGHVSGSSESGTDSTGSSARLDAALRQAAEAAGTRGIQFDESGDVSMELAEGTVTDAFQPWMNARQEQVLDEGSPIKEGAKVGPVLEKDKENVNPFSPAFKAGVTARLKSPVRTDDEQDDDSSMDITEAEGGIITQAKQVHDETSQSDDVMMDLTVAVGGIQPNSVSEETGRSIGSRRRRTLGSGSPLKVSKETRGSPISRRASRGPIAKRRQSATIASKKDDETMDYSTVTGNTQQSAAKAGGSRRASVAKRRSSAGSSVFDDDEPMDLTMAIGGIKDNDTKPVHNEDPSLNSNEELSMELTTVFGGIQDGLKAEQEERPETPITEAPPESNATPSTPKDQNRFKEVEEATPKKLTPILEKQVQTPETKTPPKTPKKSPRKSLGPSLLRNVEQATDVESAREESVVPATPEIQIDRIPVEEKENEPPTSSPKKRLGLGSATKASVTPGKTPTMRETKALSESMRLLSTPRKEVSQSPLKRLTNSTPKKQATPKTSSPFKKRLTPLKRATPSKVASPNKKVQIEVPSTPPAKSVEKFDDDDADLKRTRELERPSPERIQLQDFLGMTSIRFMELTTTKRRHTAAPSAIKGLGLYEKPSETQRSFESQVVAGACIVPTLEMFQHSCRELKHYISSGHEVVDQIAADVGESQPALFSEYANAPRVQKSIMDKQFANVKTNARLLSKGMWYEWRGQLLKSLKQGLEGIAEGLNQDAQLLAHREQMIESVLPDIRAKREDLETDKQILEEQARDLDECDEEELSEARTALIAVGNEVEEKRKQLENLQQEMQDKHEVLEMAQERKAEMIAEIAEAERVREECRGWSALEVQALQESVQALEVDHGWHITSASSTNVKMAYRNDIQLFFDMASFRLGGSSRANKSENSTIRLTYIGDDHDHRPRPLTTEKRFFLQIMRAHLQCLAQGQTRVKELLDFVASGWQRVCAISDAIGSLEGEYITEASILSDERMAIQSMMLVSKLETKVMVGFEIHAAVGDGRINIHVTPTARVAYGERYNEPKMAEFLASKVENRLDGWADAVKELRTRLIAKGQKTTRA